MTLPKLLVIGHGRHGKDTVCEYLRDQYNFTFESSSKFCSKLFIYDMLKDKYGYSNEDECYNDRHNHRAEWYNAICNYNENDAARLGKAIFAEHSIYCGLRNKAEFFEMANQNVFDFTIWVDRSKHLPKESKDSMSLEEFMADFVIDNNGTLEDLKIQIDDVIEEIIIR